MYINTLRLYGTYMGSMHSFLIVQACNNIVVSTSMPGIIKNQLFQGPPGSKGAIGVSGGRGQPGDPVGTFYIQESFETLMHCIIGSRWK